MRTADLVQQRIGAHTGTADLADHEQHRVADQRRHDRVEHQRPDQRLQHHAPRDDAKSRGYLTSWRGAFHADSAATRNGASTGSAIRASSLRERALDRRTLRRRLVAECLEVIDEHRLELDQPLAALLGRVARILERAGPAVCEQLLELAILERQHEQPIGDARGERDVVRDDDRRDAERLDLLADQPREHAHAMRIQARRSARRGTAACAGSRARARPRRAALAHPRAASPACRARRARARARRASATPPLRCASPPPWRSASSRLPRTSR